MACVYTLSFLERWYGTCYHGGSCRAAEVVWVLRAFVVACL
jgi:hypothetical protein